MINIELTGSNTASACGRTVKAKGYASPIGKLCRQLIEDGYAAHDVVNITRNGIPSFKPTLMQWWADRDVTEGEGYSARFTKHKPFSADAWAD